MAHRSYDSIDASLYAPEQAQLMDDEGLEELSLHCTAQVETFSEAPGVVAVRMRECSYSGRVSVKESKRLLPLNVREFTMFLSHKEASKLSHNIFRAVRWPETKKRKKGRGYI